MRKHFSETLVAELEVQHQSRSELLSDLASEFGEMTVDEPEVDADFPWEPPMTHPYYEHSLEEIAAEIGVSRQRVQQIIGQALVKLKAAIGGDG